MTIDYNKLRLDGIYQQDKEGNLMLRVKVPAGILSSAQAEAICTISDSLSNGILHLTSRGSIEFHWLKYESLKQVFQRLASVGLTSRGACGGAVRGISCSTAFTPGFPVVQKVIRRLHRHFAGNPYFEGLPKKFKVGVDAGYVGARYLIQDVGLVLVEGGEGKIAFDLWCAGGLGREPQAAFLLEKAVPEEQLIPLIESIVQVYRDNTPPPKRLKYLLNEIGEYRFRALLSEERANRQPEVTQQTLDGPLITTIDNFLEIPVFAGEIEASALFELARFARDHTNGFLALLPDQNIALPLAEGLDPEEIKNSLKALGLSFSDPEQQVRFRVCPGSHECRMGLARTRDVARALINVIDNGSTREQTFAISGCNNSCSQPQLADIGIVTSSLVKKETCDSEPRFDVYRRTDFSLGQRVYGGLDLVELLKIVPSLI